MRYLVISDIHANLDALEAVLSASAQLGYDRLLVLGDLVGYGAQPNDVVERIRALAPYAIIRGNHDKVAAGLEEGDGFNPIAQEAAAWTYRTLTEANRAYLEACSAGPMILEHGVEICHGSPGDEDAYITNQTGARHALEQSRAPLCFYGHTHMPVAFRMTDTGFEWLPWGDGPDRAVVVDPRARYLLNPGSVGQPRDGDARAAFALFDSAAATVIRYRVDYAVQEAQRRIIDAGLPQALARRLALGR